MKLNVGDRIQRSGDALAWVIEIVEVRPTGYSWRLVPERDTSAIYVSPVPAYMSDGNEDPLFEAEGWQVVP